jgi:hypothetical protein
MSGEWCCVRYLHEPMCLAYIPTLFLAWRRQRSWHVLGGSIGSKGRLRSSESVSIFATSANRFGITTHLHLRAFKVYPCTYEYCASYNCDQCSHSPLPIPWGAHQTISVCKSNLALKLKLVMMTRTPSKCVLIPVGELLVAGNWANREGTDIS